MHTNNRRNWLKQTSLAIAGLSIGSGAFSLEKKYPGPPNGIRLNANENPYGPSPMARKAMADAVALSNRYPFSDLTGTVREKIASKFGLAKENVLLGAGSSEILGLVAQHAALQKGNAVTAGTTFGIWWTLVQQLGLNLVKVPLNADKKHDLPAMLNKINSDTKLVYVCNPNNPTATITDATTLKNFVEEVSKQTWCYLMKLILNILKSPRWLLWWQTIRTSSLPKHFPKFMEWPAPGSGMHLLILISLRGWGNYSPGKMQVPAGFHWQASWLHWKTMIL